MIYLSGSHSSIRHPRLGFLNTPQMWNVVPDTIWAADNGRYAAPEKYSDVKYLAWLMKRDPSRCLFATAPDVVGDHAATVELARPMLAAIGALGYPPAFVAQDGWDEATTPWDLFDVLFIGGTTTFKLSHGGEAISAARRRGKRVHMGRVNSYLRLRLAAAAGCHSADGTFVKFGPDRRGRELLGWLDRLVAEPLMDMH